MRASGTRPTWLHDNEILMYGVNKDIILVIGFHGIEGYLPGWSFGWIQPISVAMDFP